MSNLGIFLSGLFVTFIVIVAIGTLIWGAILDGRDQRASDLVGDAVQRRPAAGPQQSATGTVVTE